MFIMLHIMKNYYHHELKVGIKLYRKFDFSNSRCFLSSVETC
jgi:hypothetical protein